MSTLPRKTRIAWDEPTHAHFLTYSCHERLSLLTRDRSRQWVIDAIEATRTKLNLTLWAYVIMPEHVHVLVRPTHSGALVRRILSSLKHPVARAAHTWLKETCNHEWIARLSIQYPSRTVFRFWQPGGGYDQNIFRDKTLRAVVEYIHMNPVRRGLAAVPTDWVGSSARFWEGHKDVPLQMNRLDE